MLTQILPPLRTIVSGYFTLEELIHYSEAFFALSEEHRQDKREFIAAINATIHAHLKVLEANKISLIEQVVDQPHIVLKKTLHVLQHQKETILKMDGVPVELTETLQSAGPFPEIQSIEDLVKLGIILRDLGIINPSHCQSYFAYQQISRLTKGPFSEEVPSLFGHLINLISTGYADCVLNKTATIQQRARLLRNFLNLNRICALGNWNKKRVNGVLVNYHELPIISRGWLDLLLQALPGTFVTHLDFYVSYTSVGLENLRTFSRNLLASNVTHVQVYGLPADQLSAFCPALCRSKLQSLSIPYSNISQQDCDALIETLPLCRELVECNISNSSFFSSDKSKTLFSPERLELLRKLISALARSPIRYVDLSGTFPQSLLKTILTIFAENIPGSNIEKITIYGEKARAKDRLKADEMYEQIITPALERNRELRLFAQSYTPSFEDSYQRYARVSVQGTEDVAIEELSRQFKGCSIL